jgi:hypothetical protein
MVLKIIVSLQKIPHHLVGRLPVLPAEPVKNWSSQILSLTGKRVNGQRAQPLKIIS